MSTYKGVANKKESFALYEAGDFGNKLRTWKNYAKLCEDNYCGTVTMRYVEADSRWCQYQVPQHEINDILSAWQADGASMVKVKFNESAPDHRLLIQGEIQEHSEHKFMLSYSSANVPMRSAMKHPESLLGIKAYHLLQEHFSFESFRNLKRLFATWPSAVVEFSCYDHMLGDVPENNTVFWEVRNY